ncbi:MAG: methytransferase partner Trm112 [Candidatus Thermoplasmatota archaeon]|nr:methytransferase partner Trm112 [Candidatus Thermoplasmatota archaeon]MDI6887059.1 methytransferase partner Trm112 [Candidatus Thermoplasmatota archaeon]
MKKDLLEILCCPVCKGDLELKIEKEEGNDIIEGLLICKKCGDYRIEEGVPNLLPKER